MASPDESDDDFEKKLTFPKLIEAYRQRCQNDEKECKQEYERQWNEIRKFKISGMETERAHRDLLNLAVQPFLEKSVGNTRLGYRFLHGSPLAEFGVPNFDFLIARLLPEDKPAIIIPGEVKSSIGRFPEIIKEVQDKKMHLLSKMEYILETYLCQVKTRTYILEPVLVVDLTEAKDMIAKVVDSGERIIVWHGPTTGIEMLSLAVVPDTIPDRHRFQHSENELNRLLNRVPSIRRTFDLWPQIHPVLLMGALITASILGEKWNILRLDRLKGVLNTDLFYLSDKEREDLARSLIKLGVEIGFLTPIENGDHKINAKGTSKASLEKSLQEKWIRWKIDRDQEQDIIKRKMAIRDEFILKRSTIRAIDEDWER